MDQALGPQFAHYPTIIPAFYVHSTQSYVEVVTAPMGPVLFLKKDKE